ncbi:MAG: LysE family translocator [Burkholderiales bacterium]|nr:LysE family translocator [Burkholderiales bacterium]MBX9866363.1 LysE family translocator [Burkholderiales bacterium]
MNSYIPLLLFCFSTSITPGPNNIMIMMSGAKFGLLKSFPHYLGICIGFNIMVFLVGLGLGEVFNSLPMLHVIIKYLGTLYMLYLAFSLIRSNSGISGTNERSKPLTFIQAVLFQWINPKAWIMAIGVIATYSLLNVNPVYQSFIISLIFFLVGLPCIGAWFVFGVGISKYLSSHVHMKIFNVTMGVLLIFSIILMFLE